MADTNTAKIEAARVALDRAIATFDKPLHTKAAQEWAALDASALLRLHGATVHAALDVAHAKSVEHASLLICASTLEIAVKEIVVNALTTLGIAVPELSAACERRVQELRMEIGGLTDSKGAARADT